MGQVQMDMNQLRIYRLACETIAGKYTIKEFSKLIGKSYRQAQRIIKKVENEDFLGVVHKNKFKRPHNKTSKELEELIVELLKYRYNGFNLTHFQEMIEKFEGITISKSVLHRIATKHDLVKATRRKKKRSFKLRPRMPKEGAMVQFDGSNHVWFGDVRSDLLVGIDDATGKILNAEFFFGEKSLHSLKVIKELVDKHGLPESFYMDQAGIYGKVERDWKSQVSRAFEQVNIRLILATSPQAKGRVERLFRTLQDRLVAELKYYDVKTLEQANEYLKTKFISEFNNQFGVEATDNEPAYAPNVFGNLDLIFCKKEKRRISVGNVFSWESVTWVVQSKQCYRGREVNINTHVDGSYSFDIMGKEIKAKVHKMNASRAYKKKAG